MTAHECKIKGCPDCAFAEEQAAIAEFGAKALEVFPNLDPNAGPHDPGARFPEDPGRETVTMEIKGHLYIPHSIQVEVAHTTHDGSVTAARKVAQEDAVGRPGAGPDDYRRGRAITIAGRLVRHVQWYDLHGPGHVVCCWVQAGCVLDEEEVDRIAARIETLGLEVVDRWNVGSDCVSLSVDGRGASAALFTDEQVDYLRGQTRIENMLADSAGEGQDAPAKGDQDEH